MMLRSSRGQLIVAMSCAAMVASLAAAGTGDECAGAPIAVEGVSTAFDTSVATPSPNPPADGDCPLLDWQNGKDVWFEWHPSATGFATLDFCASNYDTSVVVYRGTCDELMVVGCDDDSCGASFRSIIEDLLVDASATYFIRIGGWEAASGTGSFTITVEPIAVECLNAVGACNEVHGTPGCNDTSCCSVVCLANPLCCDFQWDNACVDLAVKYCGYFVHECTPGGPSNDCATSAMTIADGVVRAFDTTNANTDGPNEAGCNSAGPDLPIWRDLWYVFVAPANGSARATCCDTANFDTKIAAYELPGSYAAFDPDNLPQYFLACNEDGEDCEFFTSDLTFDVSVGRTYLVRLGSYLDEFGSGTIAFSLPDPCQLPSGNYTESEACGTAFNDGCNGIDFPVEGIALGTSVEGTFWSSNGVRDTDWYEFTLTSATNVTFTVHSATSADVFLVDASCPATFFAIGSGECPSVAATCLPAGTYRAIVATAAFEGTPCGSGLFNDYVAALSGRPATCPSSGDFCINSGPDEVSQNESVAIFDAGIACGAEGLSGANSFARSFPGLVGGEIRCVNFGYSNSGLPVSATLGIYRDTNGGDPINVGDDLELLAQREFLLPNSGATEIVANLDAPVCLDGNTSPIVVVLDIAASTTGFASFAGNSAGETAPTYIKADGCGIGTFTPLSTIGFDDSHWVVLINGDFARCGGVEPCLGDIDGDGNVGPTDLGILLGAWGGSGTADLDGDGGVGPTDLGILLGAWGACR